MTLRGGWGSWRTGRCPTDGKDSALENGPWLWQSNQFYTGYSSFYQFCDYVEVNASQNPANSTPNANVPQNAVGSNASVPSAAGVGLQKALDGYATWMKELLIPGCKGSRHSAAWQANLADCL